MPYSVQSGVTAAQMAAEITGDGLTVVYGTETSFVLTVFQACTPQSGVGAGVFVPPGNWYVNAGSPSSGAAHYPDLGDSGGIFSGAAGLGGDTSGGITRDRGVVLTTGSVAYSGGVMDIHPQVAASITGRKNNINNTVTPSIIAQYADWTALNATASSPNDPCSLEFDVITSGTTLEIPVWFGSNNYTEFNGDANFHPGIAVFLDGTNIAYLPDGVTLINTRDVWGQGTTKPYFDNLNALASVAQIADSIHPNECYAYPHIGYNGLVHGIGGDPYAIAPNDFPGGRQPVLLRCTVNFGQTYHLRFVVMDSLGSLTRDSGLFIGKMRCYTTYAITGTCISSPTPTRFVSNCTTPTITATPILGTAAGSVTICGVTYVLDGSGTTTLPALHDGVCPLIIRDVAGNQVFSGDFVTETWNVDDPNVLAVFSVGRSNVSSESTDRQYPDAWSIWAGPIAVTRCACLFSGTLGSTMSRDLKPYLGSASITDAIGKADTGTTDYTGPYQAYVTTRAYAPWGDGMTGSVMGGVLTGVSAPGVTIQATTVKDFGVDSRADTVSMAAAGSETRVHKRIGGSVALAGNGFVQFTIGDSAAIDNTWRLDALHVPFAKESALTG